jgi:hypothetical protein
MRDLSSWALRAIRGAAAIAALMVAGTPASAQQFSLGDYLVMQSICGRIGQGLPCVYDSHNQIVGLATITGELRRRIGGDWYDMLYQNIGLSTGYSFFYTSADCTGTAYLETGDGQKSGTILVEELPFFAAFALSEIWAPVGTPMQIQIGSEGPTPPPVSAADCASYGPNGGGPTITVRPATVVDRTVFYPLLKIR